MTKKPDTTRADCLTALHTLSVLENLHRQARWQFWHGAPENKFFWAGVQAEIEREQTIASYAVERAVPSGTFRWKNGILAQGDKR